MLAENVSLKNLNTFRVDVKIKFFAQVTNSNEVSLALNSIDKDIPVFILGGGSNVLFTKDYPGLVVKVDFKGIEVLNETDSESIIRVAAGENWHRFVIWAATKGLSGIENMAYIPGTMGAAPVQNLAAYGQTFEDVLIELEAIELASGKLQTFTKDECALAYRTSIFKNELKDKYLVTSVTIKLSKIPDYDTHYHGRYSYESLATYLKQIKEPPYTPLDVANAIILQRKAKLPEVSEYGTCGSFFVNPFITVEKFHELEQAISELQQYPISKMEYDRIDWHNTGQDQIVKIPAGRLLEELGWKGKWIGNVGTFDKHALIVVTNGKATGAEILAFAEQMKRSVLEKFGIELKSEVQIV